MATRLTREQLHSLVWAKPVIHLAAELGLSDVGLRKACHRHDVPTPPAGWWARKAHGKVTRVTPLPTTRPADELVSIHGYGAEAGSLSTAREDVRARLEEAAPGEAAPDPLVERTIARLEKARAGKDGLVRVHGPGLVTVEALRRGGDGPPGRVAGLLEWAEKRLADNEEQLSPDVLEQRLAKSGLFGEEEQYG